MIAPPTFGQYDVLTLQASSVDRLHHPKRQIVLRKHFPSDTINFMSNGVSVIVPLYNRENYIVPCLESIVSQERNFPLEILVSDDGSTDRGPDLVREFGEPVRLIARPDSCGVQGPAAARNRGIAAASYPFIAFLDSDDLFLPGHLQRLRDALVCNPDVPFAVDQMFGFDDDVERRWIMPYPEKETIRLETFFLNPYCGPPSVMMRQSLLATLPGPFDESLLMGEDVDLFLRILEQHPPAIILPEPGSAIREHDGRSTRDIGRCFRFAESAMRKAAVRHPYPKRLIRKRTAVIHFRLGQADIKAGKFITALFRLGMAFFLDPSRSLSVILRSLGKAYRKKKTADIS